MDCVGWVSGNPKRSEANADESSVALRITITAAKYRLVLCQGLRVGFL